MIRDEYAVYEAAVASFFDREEVENISFDSDESPWFSNAPCECCGSTLGGDRYAASGYVFRTGEIFHYNVCTDCLHYSMHGQLDDMTMLSINRGQEKEGAKQ